MELRRWLSYLSNFWIWSDSHCGCTSQEGLKAHKGLAYRRVPHQLFFSLRYHSDMMTSRTGSQQSYQIVIGDSTKSKAMGLRNHHYLDLISMPSMNPRHDKEGHQKGKFRGMTLVSVGPVLSWPICRLRGGRQKSRGCIQDFTFVIDWWP